MQVGPVTERGDSGGMSFLDDEEYEKGGIEMNAAARAALMQKLSQTHSAGIYNMLSCRTENISKRMI